MSIEGRPDEKQSIVTIHAALNNGLRLIDTADAYCLGSWETGHGERLVARALSTWSGDPDDVLVSTKGGQYRPGDGSWRVNGQPSYLKRACEASLEALGVDAIGLYHFHRPDPDVPFADSIGALRELLEAGKIRTAGISNTDVTQIQTALEILGKDKLVSVQNEFSPAVRTSEAELQYCGEQGITFMPWSPFGRIRAASDLVAAFPAFGRVAEAHCVSPHRVVLAWMLAKGEHVVPIPGARRPETILDSIEADRLRLSAEEIALLDGV